MAKLDYSNFHVYSEIKPRHGIWHDVANSPMPRDFMDADLPLLVVLTNSSQLVWSSSFANIAELNKAIDSLILIN